MDRILDLDSGNLDLTAKKFAYLIYILPFIYYQNPYIVEEEM